jgi:acetyl esterase/lipase
MIHQKFRKSWPGFLWILAALLLLAYSLLTIYQWPSEKGFYFNLQAIENGRWAWILALLLMCIPAWRVFKRGFIFFLLALLASVLLSRPLIQSSRLTESIGLQFTNYKGNFSFSKWLFAQSELSVPKFIQTPNDTLSALYYSSTNVKAKAVIILLHGGGFYQGAPQWMGALSSELAHKGYDVMAPSYPLEPNAFYPNSSFILLSHLNRWLDFIYGPIQNRPSLFFAGSSAGGTLALNTAALSTLKVNGVVALYPISDFTQPIHSISDIRRIVQAYIQNNQLKQASPLFTNKKLPLLLLHGEKDPIVPINQSRIMYLNSNYFPKHYFELPWATHSFEYPIYGPSGQFTVQAIDAFVQKYQ